MKPSLDFVLLSVILGGVVLALATSGCSTTRYNECYDFEYDRCDWSAPLADCDLYARRICSDYISPGRKNVDN